MAFSEHNITQMSDIPPLVKAFATTIGFTVGGTDENPTVTHPSMVDALVFTLSEGQQGSTSTQRRYLRWTAPGDYGASTCVPRRGTSSSSPTHLAPTKLMLFGSTDAEPWLAIVIAFGFNLYRHLYLGWMEKNVDYDGGEVISGTSFFDTHSSVSSISYADDENQYLFSAWCSSTRFSEDLRGAARIEHENNPSTRRKFSGYTFSSSAALPTDAIYGGMMDGWNEGYVAAGRSFFSGEVIFNPVNLYISMPETRFVQVGRPPGVRYVNITDIEPETVMTYLGKEWMVIPAFSKKSTATVTKPAASFPTEETSYSIGIAYLRG